MSTPTRTFNLLLLLRPTLTPTIDLFRSFVFRVLRWDPALEDDDERSNSEGGSTASGIRLAQSVG